MDAKRVRTSVCMATCDGASYLREQIDSILAQLSAEDELIVSDDHSIDGTLAIASSYQDARIRIVLNPARRGHVQNFANAMRYAKGEFLALSDQDDIWVDGRLGRMLEALRRLPASSLVVGDFVEFTEAGIQASGDLGPSPRMKLCQLFNVFAGRAKYFGSTFAFRRELLRYVLPIPSYVEAHDIWIAMMACIHGGVVHLQETTLLRRIHQNNLTPTRRRALPIVIRSRIGYLGGLARSALR